MKFLEILLIGCLCLLAKGLDPDWGPGTIWNHELP